MRNLSPKWDFYLGMLIFAITVGFLLLCVVFITFGMKTPETGSYELTEASLTMVESNTLVAITSHYYYQPKVLGSVIENVIMCESSGRHYKSNGEILRGRSGEYGIGQFMPQTWDWFNEIRGTNLNIMCEQDQLAMMKWAFDSGYHNHWTCYRIIYE